MFGIQRDKFQHLDCPITQTRMSLGIIIESSEPSHPAAHSEKTVKKLESFHKCIQRKTARILHVNKTFKRGFGIACVRLSRDRISNRKTRQLSIASLH